MGILYSFSNVLYVIICVFLVIIILLQSDKGAGMGILGGSTQSAFGSSTADVITKTTAVLITLFMVGALGLAVLESSSSISKEREFFDKTQHESVEKVTESVSVEREGAVNDKLPGKGVPGGDDADTLKRKLDDMGKTVPGK